MMKNPTGMRREPCLFHLLYLTLTFTPAMSRTPKVAWQTNWDVTTSGALERRVRNSRQCARLCELSVPCQAVSFDAPSGVCRLHFSTPGEVTEQPQVVEDAMYGTVEKQTSSCRGCTCRPCDVGEHCAPVSTNSRFLCLNAAEDFHCPHDPPPLPDGTVHVTGTSLHATGVYTCNTRFTFLGASRHVTCAGALSWEGLNGTCFRTSWTRPNMTAIDTDQFRWIRKFPKPVTTGGRVEMIAENTKDNLTLVKLRSGADVMLSMAMRMRFSRGDKVCILQSVVNGSRLGKVTLQGAPFAAGHVYNLTFLLLDDPPAVQLIYDDSTYYTYVCPAACGRVTHLEVLKYVKLRAVHIHYPEC